ncbi:MAG: AAA family ATPase [Oscillospiraceae bacterium]|nr:AAA family ATPase [Oscillospiraceae bacterium]
MAEIYLVISGKGGVGKSTVSTMLGAAFARKGKKTLLVETDWGQRGLDVMNGVHHNVVYDIRDLLAQRCSVEKAVINSKLSANLFLLPACPDRSFQPSKNDLERLFSKLTGVYDCIIIDSAAGLTKSAEFCMDIANTALLTVTPDLLTVRIAASLAGQLAQKGLPARLVINRIPQRWKPTSAIPDLDAVIDLVGVQLVGAVPMDNELGELLCTMEDGHWAKMASIKSAEVFRRIADRLNGEYVPLYVK